MMLGVVGLEHTLMNSHEQYKSCFNKTVHFTLFYPILKAKKVNSNKNSRKLEIPKNFQNSFQKSFFKKLKFKNTV